jgi:hypothetical protein
MGFVGGLRTGAISSLLFPDDKGNAPARIFLSMGGSEMCFQNMVRDGRMVRRAPNGGDHIYCLY